MAKPLKSFLTGSRVYGVPSVESDIDLVVRVSDDDARRLAAMAEQIGCGQFGPDGRGASLRFGALNLIVVADDREFKVWAEGTRRLLARAPVSREEAVETFRRLREDAGVRESFYAAAEEAELAGRES